MYGSWIADVGQVDNRFPLSGMLRKFVGQTPGSARDALVPHLEERGQRLAGCDRPTRASAAVQGGRPTIGAGALSGKTSGIYNA